MLKYRQMRNCNLTETETLEAKKAPWKVTRDVKYSCQQLRRNKPEERYIMQSQNEQTAEKDKDVNCSKPLKRMILP